MRLSFPQVASAISGSQFTKPSLAGDARIADLSLPLQKPQPPFCRRKDSQSTHGSATSRHMEWQWWGREEDTCAQGDEEEERGGGAGPRVWASRTRVGAPPDHATASCKADHGSKPAPAPSPPTCSWIWISTWICHLFDLTDLSTPIL